MCFPVTNCFQVCIILLFLFSSSTHDCILVKKKKFSCFLHMTSIDPQYSLIQTRLSQNQVIIFIITVLFFCSCQTCFDTSSHIDGVVCTTASPICHIVALMLFFLNSRYFVEIQTFLVCKLFQKHYGIAT